MSRSEDLVRRWNQKAYVESYLRAMTAREYDGNECTRKAVQMPVATEIARRNRDDARGHH